MIIPFDKDVIDALIEANNSAINVARNLERLQNKKKPMPQDEVTPPILGLRPEFIVREHRMVEIIEAIARFKIANKPVPEEWHKELAKLVAEDIAWKRSKKESDSPLKDHS